PAEWPFLKGNVEPPLGGLKKGVSLNRTSRSWIKRSKIWGSVHYDPSEMELLKALALKNT
ncbi:hypothetical protein, partial [Yersinia pestis]|uniref:hypothetical protein n=1 Tax=Yersinia pestis TaxID=632 RepID=UPI000627C492